jgi:anti-sigma-K factor RskA
MTAEDRFLLAGEHALGLLDGPEQAEALRLLIADPAFAGDVAWWREHLAPLFAEMQERGPDPALEERVLAALPRQTSGVPTMLRVWRAVAATAALVAASLVAAILLRPEAAVPPAATVHQAPASLVAALAPTPDAGSALDGPVAAVFDRASGVLALGQAPEVPAGRVAELWSIGGDGVPRTLGLLKGNTRIPLENDRRARLIAGVTIAISVEPTGGSASGSPTGPVIATGMVRDL